MPESLKGTHFAPTLQSFILSQYYQQHVTQPLILKQLREFGIQISAGQLGHLITEGHQKFHEEKDEILRVGLEVSSYINVDDTGTRQQGKTESAPILAMSSLPGLRVQKVKVGSTSWNCSERVKRSI